MGIRDRVRRVLGTLGFGSGSGPDPERRKLLGMAGGLAGTALAVQGMLKANTALAAATPPQKRVLGLGSKILCAGSLDWIPDVDTGEYVPSSIRHDIPGKYVCTPTTFTAKVPMDGVLGRLCIASDDPPSLTIERVCVDGVEYLLGEGAPLSRAPTGEEFTFRHPVTDEMLPAFEESVLPAPEDFVFDIPVRRGAEVIVVLKNKDAGSGHIATAAFTFTT